MANGHSGAYLPGDPRYGLGPEELAAYYRDKPAQWAIFCWDRGGTLEARGTHLQDQRLYVGTFGERVIGYGHLVSDNGLDTLGTTFFMQLDDRGAVDQFLADEPLNRAGVYDRIDIRRWSNSFQKRQADYQRKGMQQFRFSRSDHLARWLRQYRHGAAGRAARPRRRGGILEQRALRGQRRLPGRFADLSLGIRRLAAKSGSV
jgi:hypothetical protein